MASLRKARLVTAELIAAVTLLLSLLYVARFYDPGLPSLATYTGAGAALLAILLSIVAFVFSVRIRSATIAGLLIVGGVMMQIPPIQAIVEAGAVVVPGPILGVVSFAPILVLGLVKAVGLRMKVTKGRTAGGGYSVAISTMILSTINGTTSSTSSSWVGRWGGWGGWGASHGWWWPFGFPLLLVGSVVVVGVVLFLALWSAASSGRGGTPQKNGSAALVIIEERYAKGEITKEQFEQMKKDMQRS